MARGTKEHFNFARAYWMNFTSEDDNSDKSYLKIKIEKRLIGKV